MLTSGIGNNENHWIWTFNFWVMSFFPKGHKYLVFFSNGSLHSKHFLLLLHWEYLSSIVHPTWIPRLLKGRKWTVFGGKRIHSMLFCWLFVDYEIAIDCSTHGSLVDLGRDGAHNTEPGASLELFYSGDVRVSNKALWNVCSHCVSCYALRRRPNPLKTLLCWAWCVEQSIVISTVYRYNAKIHVKIAHHVSGEIND